MEELMPVPFVWAWQVANVSQPSIRCIPLTNTGITMSAQSRSRDRKHLQLTNRWINYHLCSVWMMCAQAPPAQTCDSQPLHSDVVRSPSTVCSVCSTMSWTSKRWKRSRRFSKMTELRGTTSGNNPQGSAVSATLLERPGPVAIIYICVYVCIHIHIYS